MRYKNNLISKFWIIFIKMSGEFQTVKIKIEYQKIAL